MKRLTRIAALAAVTAASLPAVASAHVTLQPSEATAGDFARLDVRVPSERDDASTKKVEVQFPPGFIFASYEPVPGWTAEMKMAKLDKPVEAFGEQHSEQVDTVTFTATGDGVEPGQFQDFGLSVGLPDEPGTTLKFKALQTYSNGEVVRWIGDPDSDEPAAQVELLAADAEPGAEAHGGDPEEEAAPGDEAEEAATPTAAGGDAEEGSDTLSIIALIVGLLGLLAGLAGLAAARRARGTATA